VLEAEKRVTATVVSEGKIETSHFVSRNDRVDLSGKQTTGLSGTISGSGGGGSGTMCLGVDRPLYGRRKRSIKRQEEVYAPSTLEKGGVAIPSASDSNFPLTVKKKVSYKKGEAS